MSLNFNEMSEKQLKRLCKQAYMEVKESSKLSEADRKLMEKQLSMELCCRPGKFESALEAKQFEMIYMFEVTSRKLQECNNIEEMMQIREAQKAWQDNIECRWRLFLEEQNAIFPRMVRIRRRFISWLKNIFWILRG